MFVSETNATLSYGSHLDIVCSHLASPFPCPTDMSVAFLHHIVDDVTTDQKLTMSKLSALASALTNDRFTLNPFSSLNNVKCDAMRLFNCILAAETLDDNLILLPSCLRHIQGLSCKLSLILISFLFNPVHLTVIFELLSSVVFYPSTKCIQNVDVNHWDNSPKGCVSSLKTFLSSGLQVETSLFIVFALSKCCTNMSLKPLH